MSSEDAYLAGDDYGAPEVGPGSGGASDTADDPAQPEPDEPADPSGGQACNTADDVRLFLSPDDSNSMSSPVQARAALLSEWASLAQVAIRPWEFLNYYRIAYPAAPAGSLGVHAAMVISSDEAEGEYLLQIGVASPLATVAARPPMNLTFVLDTSGSMDGAPLQALQASCRAIAENLVEGDVVSLVTWNTANAIVLANHPVGGANDAALLSAIDGLWADGGTDLHGGLVAGYELAAQAHRPGVVSRVILISDGGANVGVTDVDTIAQHAGAENQDGIYMVGVGVGTAESYNDTLMDIVTDAGKGASVFVPDASEAARVFGERFVSTMAIAARDVRVELELPPGFEIVRFSGEEYSADPSEIEPQHLAPDDAMVFHQRIRTCAPQDVSPEDPVTITIRWADPVSFAVQEQVLDTTIGELLAADSALLLEGAAIFEYATALQAMQQSEVDADGALERARVALFRARAAAPEDPDLQEISTVLASL